MEVKFKMLSTDAVLPTKAHPGDAGLDLYATSHGLSFYASPYIEYKTGIAAEIPEGYVGLLFPRSSISNYNLQLANSVGVLDSCYRGEITFRFRKYGSKVYNRGDKIGQLVIVPYLNATAVESFGLSDTERGSGGYGSSGQ